MKNIFDYLFFREGLYGIWKVKIWPYRWYPWEKTMILIKWIIISLVFIPLLSFTIPVVLICSLLLPVAFLTFGLKAINKLKKILSDKTLPYLWNIKDYYHCLEFPLSCVSVLAGLVGGSLIFASIISADITLPNLIHRFLIFLVAVSCILAGFKKMDQNENKDSLEITSQPA